MLQALKPENAYKNAPIIAESSRITFLLMKIYAEAAPTEYLRAIKKGIIYGIKLSGNGTVSQKNGLPNR